MEYRNDIRVSDLPATSTVLDLAFKVVYSQSDGTGNTINDNGVRYIEIVSGDYDMVGSEICISDECFYVISSTDDTVTMLAKYNLLVGNSVADSSYATTALTNPTGIQDSVAMRPTWMKTGLKYTLGMVF